MTMFDVFKMVPEKASTLSHSVDALYLGLTVIAFFFSILIFVLIVFFAIRYRRKSDDEVPEQNHGNWMLEIVWCVIPLMITMTIFIWGTSVYFKNYRPPANALEIFVVGKQWMWKIQHPEGPREINELHVPINRPVKLKMTSEDVIHSFFIPAFRTKMDVVPGRYTTNWFEAIKPGRYHLFCAEYCGTKHAGMTGSIVAMKENEYEQWLAEASGQEVSEGGTVVERGEKLFKQMRCYTCHNEQQTALGAKLEGIYGKPVELADGRTVTADDNYLRESIVHPQAKVVKGFDPVMPTFKNQLSEEQIMALIEYIKSLDKETAKSEEA